jgi:hypothetical protein
LKTFKKQKMKKTLLVSLLAIFTIAANAANKIGGISQELKINSIATQASKQESRIKFQKAYDATGSFSTSCGDWDFWISCPSCTCSQLTSMVLQLIVLAEQACETGETEVSI